MPAAAHAVGPRYPTSSDGGVGMPSSSVNSRPCSPAIRTASECAGVSSGRTWSPLPVTTASHLNIRGVAADCLGPWPGAGRHVGRTTRTCENDIQGLSVTVSLPTRRVNVVPRRVAFHGNSHLGIALRDLHLSP